MKALFNFLRGMILLEVTAPFPERFINLCAQGNIEFWAMEQLDQHTLRLTARRRYKKRSWPSPKSWGARYIWRAAGACPIFWGGSGPGTPFWRGCASRCARCSFSPGSS